MYVIAGINQGCKNDFLCLLGVKGNFLNMLTVDFKEVTRRENLEHLLENLF